MKIKMFKFHPNHFIVSWKLHNMWINCLLGNLQVVDSHTHKEMSVQISLQIMVPVLLVHLGGMTVLVSFERIFFRDWFGFPIYCFP